MDKKEEYRQKLEEQLKEWKTKIELLEEKAAKTVSEVKGSSSNMLTELTEEIKELSQKKEVVKEKLAELQKLSGESWESVKEGLEKTVAELKDKLDRVISRFK